MAGIGSRALGQVTLFLVLLPGTQLVLELYRGILLACASEIEWLEGWGLVSPSLPLLVAFDSLYVVCSAN